MASALDVILVDDVEHLGKAGELVNVRPGYARNFLLPRGFAILANRFTLDEYEERKAELEEQAKKKREESEKLKLKLDGLSITIEAKAGETGKLFGAITKENIVETLKDQSSTQISKDQIELKSPIRTIGEHNVHLKIASGISANLVVNVKTI